jgi:uncharacterized protein (DUF58 family)
LALLALIVGLLFNDFQLAILVLPIASLFVFANLWGLPENLDLALKRSILPSETFGNDDIDVISEVVNRSSTNLHNVEIKENLPAGISLVKGNNRTSASVNPNEAVRLAFQFPSPERGHYEIGPLLVRARDPFGFYLNEARLEPDTLAVIPRPEKMRGVTLRPRYIGPWPGNIPSRNLGIGTEFYSMRNYLTGDDPKRINWKATARFNRLIVNETEAERVTDIMVVLDTDVTFDPSKEEFERWVTAAASMTSLFLRQGNRVGLVLQGGERGSTPAGFGKRHERRILFLLALAQPGRATVATGYVVNLLARRMLPARSQIVIISPLLDPEIIYGIRQLGAAGYSLLIIAPTPIPPSLFQTETEEIAYRIMMLERTNILLALEKTATVIHWPAGVPLSARLVKVRQTRPIAYA